MAWRGVVDGAVLGVRIDPWVDPGTADLLRRSLGGYRAVGADHPPVARLDVAAARTRRVPRTDELVIRGDRSDLPWAQSLACGPDYALFALTHWIGEASLRLGWPDALRLHAAAFASRDRTWLVAGPSGAGKTTLTADAVARGATYVTEERVTVFRSGGTVRVAGLARPLRSRAGSTLGGTRRLPADADDGFRRVTFADQLGTGGVAATPVRPTDLVLLAERVAPTVTPAWVVRQLLELALNAQEVGPSALEDLAVLVGAVRLHVVGARTLRSVHDLVTTRPWATRRAGPSRVERIAPQVGPAEVRGDLAPSAGVATVTIGDECLVWVPAGAEGSPRVLQLGGSAARWWRDLVAGALVGPAPAALVADLRAAGGLVA